MVWMVVLVLIVCLYCVIERSGDQNRGQQGETEIYDTLKKLGGRKVMLSNCYLPLRNGETTEVDLILIHESGIYVIESKNYRGKIFGSEEQKYWTQSFSDRKGSTHKYRFYNPVWQNDTHIKALQRALGDAKVNIYSYIVFGDECVLMDIEQCSDDYCVTQRKDLLPSIKATARANRKRLSHKMIHEYYGRLHPYTQVSEKKKAEHVYQVHEKYGM